MFERFPSLLACLLIAGCVATPYLQETKRITGKLDRYDAVRVVVDAPDIIRRMNGYDRTSAALACRVSENPGQTRTAGQSRFSPRVTSTQS